MDDRLEQLRNTIASAADVADFRRRIGASASVRAAASDGSWQAQWRATVAARLPRQQWPERSLLITAVDAQTGEPLAFDRYSGVELVDAVAASCAGGGIAYRIADHLYIDGGYRRSSGNADLAAGYKRVLVLSQLGGATLHPPQWRSHLSAQVEELRASGSKVETIMPTSSSQHLFGANAMDGSLRPAAARAGHEQGQALAQLIATFWR